MSVQDDRVARNPLLHVDQPAAPEAQRLLGTLQHDGSCAPELDRARIDRWAVTTQQTVR